ncbi:hypothetical protein [Streptomyces sp. Ru72]|uniref:hypothetical protein n=1 Tax=Streptomyces sp. Ru72 TaxID=2080747 RepID=UPI000CDD5487|nr:hypothetical protein [Streptomyces sp. Ru72]POX45581.1 hypothetical protein C3488_29205 [Streptomyces sp. Ru72]
MDTTNTPGNPDTSADSVTQVLDRLARLELRDDLIAIGLSVLLGVVSTLLGAGVAYYGFVLGQDARAGACAFFATITAGACGRLGHRAVTRLRARLRSHSGPSGQA